MKTFSINGKPLFSWTVIEREVKRMMEKDTNLVKLPPMKNAKIWYPKNFKLERTTVWSFPRRGSWAVHRSDYRGNWAPQVPRNLILRYTKPKELVLDPFVGGGTTLIEAWLTGRRSIGIDINPIAHEIAKHSLKELEDLARNFPGLHLAPDIKPLLILGDSRKLIQILSEYGYEEGDVDLVCAHPPYFNSLRYTENIEGDLSHINKLDNFCKEIYNIAKQLHLLLKDEGICAVLIGDVRKNKRMVPLGFRIMKEFENAGFQIKDIIIKLQHQDQSTQFWYRNNNLDFLIAHEYLFIFKK